MGNKVLLHPLVEKEHRKYGDILLPDTIKEKATNVAIVLGVGPKAEQQHELFVGDRVIMSEQDRGTPIHQGRDIFRLVDAKFILAVL
jgi:co-chaperonin GroES (HSP10)